MAVATVDVKVDARSAVQQLKQVTDQSKQLQRATDQATESISKQGKASEVASRLMRGLGGAIASFGAGALVTGMVRGAASAEQLQLRLKLLSAEYNETAKVQQFVTEAAKTFGQSQVEAATGVADVYARLRPLGISLDRIQTIYKGFNAVALASGTSAEAASGAFLQLSQALGSGALQGDEFRSIAEQVPGILKLLSDEMGVSVGELKNLGSEGKITSDILINALSKGFEQNSGKIKQLLDQSPAQKFKEFSNATQELSNALGSELLPVLVPIVKSATELLKQFGQLPKPVKTIIAAVVGLSAAFVALAPAIAAVKGILGATAVAGLLAAGPWLALAAGITAAAVALSNFLGKRNSVASSKAAKIPGYAKGGVVSRRTVAMVGEGGEREYIVPESKMATASARFLSGARGDAVIPSTSGATASRSGASPQINITTGPVVEFNGQRYVTLADLERAMRMTADSVIGKLRTPAAQIALGFA
jgi:tape measure domain